LVAKTTGPEEKCGDLVEGMGRLRAELRFEAAVPTNYRSLSELQNAIGWYFFQLVT
jgi:hypothetical protein